MTTPKSDAYDRITDQVLALMDKGVTPWRKTWKGSALTDGPCSMSTSKPYRGINLWLLSLAEMASEGYGRFWGTYKAIKTNGGTVRKGEKGTVVVFWKWLKVKDKATQEEKTVPFLRYFTVFNAAQADWEDGLPAKFQPVPDGEGEEAEFTPDEAAETIVQGYLKGANPPSFKANGGDRAFYSPPADSVTVPKATSFEGPGEYYSTVFHELGHSTGAAQRLKRPGIVDFNGFGSHQYSKEELVAEFTACFLCADAGIEDTRENSAAYLKNWAKVIKGDRKLIIQAASQGKNAAAFIQNGGVKPQYTAEAA